MDYSPLKEGGPYDVKRVGKDEFSLKIPIPTDSEGFMGRDCPDAECSPGYFKVKPGTGVTEGHTAAYCPYCRRTDDPSEFLAKDQHRYCEDILERETLTGMERVMREALGFRTSRSQRIDAGLFSVELSYEPPTFPSIKRPVEEELWRIITCQHCGLEHAVFGLATWCADCGHDIFLTHLEAECASLKAVLGDVERRRETLGARVAAKDVENALEDIVSILEAVFKHITVRWLKLAGKTQDEIDVVFISRIRNKYQNLRQAREILLKHCGIDLLKHTAETEFEKLAETLEKRHPITHNLGVIDRQYLSKVRTQEAVGRELRITASQVEQVIDQIFQILSHAYHEAFPPAKPTE